MSKQQPENESVCVCVCIKRVRAAGKRSLQDQTLN